MSSPGDVLVRIDTIEEELRDLSDEVRSLRLRVDAVAAGAAAASAPVTAPGPRVEARPASTPQSRVSVPPAAAEPLRAAEALRVTPPRPPQPPAPPRPPRRTAADLARDWDLLGARGFAIVGGAVTALGIVLLFVLAANRGWITPAMRVGIGVVASAAAVGAGFWVRSRYGQLQASVGAVGAGICGSYACLAAAAARYDLVPDWLALPLAAVIAAVAVAIALAWSSELVAVLGLLGAALAPGLQAIDTGMTSPAAAFSVIVLAATVPLAILRRWSTLLVSTAAVVTGQVAWLAHASHHAADAGTVAVVAALVLVGLAAAVLLQLRAETSDLDPLASSFALASVGITLLIVRELFDDERQMGVALATAAVVFAATWAVLRVRQPALALVLGVSALALAAVASADVLTGTGLAVTWAAESALLSLLAWRLRDARLQLMALGYAALAAANALANNRPDVIFHDPVSAHAALSAASVAVAVIAAGLLAPVQTGARTETGLLAWLAAVRAELAKHHLAIREWLVFAGAALGTYAAALALVSVSFQEGHVAATILAATVGVAVTAAASRRVSVGLVAASFAWLSGVFVVAATFDVDEFGTGFSDRSYGGWALIAASFGALAGGYLFQRLYPKPGAPVVPGIAALRLSSACPPGWHWSHLPFRSSGRPGSAIASSFLALVFLALSASVFRSERHRDTATVMWGLGIAALLGSEWLVIDDLVWRSGRLCGHGSPDRPPRPAAA